MYISHQWSWTSSRLSRPDHCSVGDIARSLSRCGKLSAHMPFSANQFPLNATLLSFSPFESLEPRRLSLYLLRASLARHRRLSTLIYVSPHTVDQMPISPPKTGPIEIPRYCDHCLHGLNFKYWCTVPISNEEEAALISIYLQIDHPLIRLVDAGLFLGDLIAQKLDLVRNIM